MEGLLDDNQVARYLRDGFVVLEAGELDADFHAGMFDAACGVHDEARVVGGDSVNLQIIGDNLRARIPGVERLLASPTVRGALTSVLGDGYYLHPHHFVHESTPRDQAFHQDGNLPWNDRSHYRTHRPNWAMLFYYPQAVADDNGPTEILPGTQYWTTNFEKADGTWHRGDALVKDARSVDLASDDPGRRERHIREGVESLGITGIRRHRIRVPAGAVVVAHYDLMHRGTRVDAPFAGRRFMYKFYLLRSRDPVAPTWRNTNREPPGRCPGRLDGIVEHIWHWMRGDKGWRAHVEDQGQADRVEAAQAEDERMRLAYEIGALARNNAGVRDELARLMNADDEALRRSMAYAAGVAGGVMEPRVLRALSNDDARVRRIAAFAAGEARLATPAAVDALFARLEQDQDDLVRSNAAYALGNIARVPTAPVAADRLLARLDPFVEPDNSGNGGMSRSTVRESVVYALCNMRLCDADLSTLARVGLSDHDRYVRGLAVVILEHHARARGGSWMGAFVEHLTRARFNHRPPRRASA